MWGGGVFPYDMIGKDDNVVIYGLGKLGHAYLDQIERTNYCNIIAVSDKKGNMENGDYRYVSPEKIFNVDFDFIVIAVDSLETSTEIYWYLISMGINKERIVSRHLAGDVFFPCYVPEGIDGGYSKDEPLKIAVTLDGGLGDYIVALSFIRKLRGLASNITIDIYGKKWISDVIFANEAYISGIYVADTGVENPDKYKRPYNIAFRMLFIVRLEYIDWPCVKAKARLLYERIIASKKDLRISDIKTTTDSFLAIHQRAQKLGFNRYQFLGQGDIWGLSESDSKLFLVDEYKHRFEQLNLDKYITFNYGASNVPGQDGKVQTKVWPIYNFSNFIIRFKQEYPDIKVVQLGDKNSKKIAEADEVFLDENLELIKHILANAIFHLDGEGGLVHMATQLGTKCVVLFGPTPVWFYGYASNSNIVSEVCVNCCHIKFDWYTECLRGYAQARCMEEISVDRVMEEVKELKI